MFRACKEKRATARVFFKKKMGINSITFEQSYGLLDEGAMGISNWRNFGTILADSLDEFRIIYDEEGEEGLRIYLKE